MPNGGKDPTALSKCQVAASSSSPLVTEWPASEKANLEARLREGGIVVAYSGCSMRLLTQCHVKGSYAWQPTTVSTDAIEITNADELYAKLPLGAASLEGELKSSGRLVVQTTIAGQMKLEGLATSDVPTDGDCAGATHIVSGVSVGAFKLLAGGSTSAKGGVAVGSAGVGGGTSAQEVLVRMAGDGAKCSESTSEKPAPACQSPVQIFLWPLPKKASQTAIAEGDEAPAPDAVQVNFMSDTTSDTWHVLEGGRIVCEAPCKRWVRRGTKVEMERTSARSVEAERLTLDLARFPTGRPVDAVAHKDRVGPLIAGAIIGALGGVIGGMGAVTTAVGYLGGGSESKSVRVAGPILLSVGATMGAVGIWLLVIGNPPGVEVNYASEPAPASMRLGPGFLTGTTGGKSNVSYVLTPFSLSGTF